MCASWQRSWQRCPIPYNAERWTCEDVVSMWISCATTSTIKLNYKINYRPIARPFSIAVIFWRLMCSGVQRFCPVQSTVKSISRWAKEKNRTNRRLIQLSLGIAQCMGFCLVRDSRAPTHATSKCTIVHACDMAPSLYVPKNPLKSYYATPTQSHLISWKIWFYYTWPTGHRAHTPYVMYGQRTLAHWNGCRTFFYHFEVMRV